MSPVESTLRQLAVLGGQPKFPPGHPVPLIRPQGYRPKGDYSAVDAVLANDNTDDSAVRASQQRFVAKILPGVGSPGHSYRVTLQNRVGEFLELDPIKSSVVCTTSGTAALRAVLKGVRVACGSDGRDEVIVPQTTVGATVEAVIDEGFRTVFVPVDPVSWLLSREATERAITDKTAAIITVDWLGTQCDLEPFRKLADEHDIKLISDSAQSFGASNGRSPAVLYAHATIYSLGYPKVLTGAGSGGLIVCSEPLERHLQSDPSGILRHETMAEVNAFMALRALESLPVALKARRAAGELYRRRLAALPGITFQQVPAGMGANHYQVSFTVDTKAFGLSAKELCETLGAENVHCSAARMPCVAANEKFASLGRVEGSLEHSRLLAATSLTLPISNDISLDTVATICDLVELIHEKAAEIVEAQGKPASVPTAPSNSADVIDLESKFRQHLFVPVLDDASAHSNVLIPRDYLHEHHISIDEFIDHFKSRQQWNRGEHVLGELRVDAIIGTVVIVAPHSAAQPRALAVPSPWTRADPRRASSWCRVPTAS